MWLTPEACLSIHANNLLFCLPMFDSKGWTRTVLLASLCFECHNQQPSEQKNTNTIFTTLIHQGTSHELSTQIVM